MISLLFLKFLPPELFPPHIMYETAAVTAAPSPIIGITWSRGIEIKDITLIWFAFQYIANYVTLQ